jgi:CRISPR-associated protein Cmr2
VVDREVADARARECEAACRALWRGIAEDVRHQLDDRIRSCEDLAAYCDGWDRLWSEQLDSFFEIRTAILPWRMVDRAVLERWLPSSEIRADEKGGLWDGRLKLLFRLMQAARSVRHVPAYFPDGSVPQKCSIMGSYEQMGPSDLADGRFKGLLAVDVAILSPRRDAYKSRGATSAPSVWSSDTPGR